MRSLPYYTSTEIEGIDEVIRETGAAVGLEIERIPPEDVTASGHESERIVSSGEWGFELTFGVESDDGRTDPETPRSEHSRVPLPRISLSGRRWFHSPWENGVSQDAYQRRVDTTFEFICRLAMAIDVEYAPMLGLVDPLQCWPTDYPLTDHIEDLPIFGIYSQSALDDLGGLSEMFDRSLWYVAELPSGHTVVVQEDFPWNRMEWKPPSDADFLEATSRYVPTTVPDSEVKTR